MADNSPAAQLERQLDRVIQENERLRADNEELKKTGVCTQAERRVLDAVKLVPATWLEMAVGSSQITRGLALLAAAELARREAK